MPFRTACPRILLLCLLCLLWISVSGSPRAQISTADWPQWRGPQRNGEATLTAPATWPASLTKRWEVAAGAGHSSPVISGNRVVLHAREGEREVVARDRSRDRPRRLAQRLRRALHDESGREQARPGTEIDAGRRRRPRDHVRDQRHPVGATISRPANCSGGCKPPPVPPHVSAPRCRRARRQSSDRARGRREQGRRSPRSMPRPAPCAGAGQVMVPHTPRRSSPTSAAQGRSSRRHEKSVVAVNAADGHAALANPVHDQFRAELGHAHRARRRRDLLRSGQRHHGRPRREKGHDMGDRTGVEERGRVDVHEHAGGERRNALWPLAQATAGSSSPST